MAEPLKNQFGVEIPNKIARMIFSVYPAFDQTAFIKAALDGYKALDLMPRGWKIARTLRGYLPDNYIEAVGILIASLGPKYGQTEGHGMAPFLYLPHACFVSEYGLDYFEISMRAQYELTQRFTAEFSIRPYLERYPEATLARLKIWAKDPNPHVRRLVSEGTRPRLPWASRLRQFQKDPRPVLVLLDILKDDPELYVRRSVANNLNDIGKDHPHLLAETAHKWLIGASEERRWLVQHALRSAIKRAEPGALKVLGFDKKVQVSITGAQITPQRAKIGSCVAIAFELTNTTTRPQHLLVDFRIHFIKANGKARAKVFKLKTVNLAPTATLRIGKKISLAEMTTRKHYAGTHQVDVMINGNIKPLGTFELIGNN
jgi:3-methyladenine DNA glycosylase AlkC